MADGVFVRTLRWCFISVDMWHHWRMVALQALNVYINRWNSINMMTREEPDLWMVLMLRLYRHSERAETLWGRRSQRREQRSFPKCLIWSDVPPRSHTQAHTALPHADIHFKLNLKKLRSCSCTAWVNYYAKEEAQQWWRSGSELPCCAAASLANQSRVWSHAVFTVEAVHLHQHHTCC